MLRERLPKRLRLPHCERELIDEKKVLFRLNQLFEVVGSSYLVAITSRDIRHRNNRLFGDDRILGYLAGVPKLVYGGNPLVKLGKIYPILPKDFPHNVTPTSGPRLGTPKLNFHQIDGCSCPVCPWRWPVCNMRFLRAQKVNLIEKRFFFVTYYPNRGG